jgi:bacterioferritin
MATTPAKAKETHQPFVTDIQELRRRAREHMEQGAVTSAYKADRETVIRILNEVLATEIVCVLRYKRHYYMATGIHAQAVAADHAQYAEGKNLLDMVREDLIAERIAVESYNEIIRYLGNDDPTTRIAMEKILSKEEEHADDMKKLLETLSKDERFAEHA